MALQHPCLLTDSELARAPRPGELRNRLIKPAKTAPRPAQLPFSSWLHIAALQRRH